jgi:peroxiredoxin
VSDHLLTLPEGLPVPEDDGACDHLAGTALPSLVLESSAGPVDVRDLDVLFVYPRAGLPGRDPLPGWDEIPGARGCTPQACAFRDRHAALVALGVRVAGLSAQTVDEQRELAALRSLPFPVVADPELRLRDALRLPTFEAGGETLYRRVTLVAEDGRIAKVFYPVFPPDRNAGDVVEWLEARG